VPTLETPMSPGGSQASAGEGLSPCNIGIGIGIITVNSSTRLAPGSGCPGAQWEAPARLVTVT